MKYARQILIDIANEFQNDFLTIGGYADHHELSDEHAEQLIRLAQAVRAAEHPDA